MRSEKERKRARRKIERRVKLVAVLVPVFAFLILGGCYSYAKYYTESYKQGIAIASGVYFTANYAVEVESETDDFIEKVVEAKYEGNVYTYEFEVRNFENNLLFNESTVVIPYSVSFWLESAPKDGATYKVVYDGKEVNLSVGEPTEATFYMHSIAGGRANANEYTITVIMSGSEHTPVPVCVKVKTETGAIISSTLKGKMVLDDSGTPNYIQSQQFVVSAQVSNDEQRFAALKEMSGFQYEIRTVGNVTNSEEVTEELKLSWDPTVLEIDLFDKAYLAWKKRELEKAAEGTTITGPYIYSDSNGKEWYYITVEVMPYSAETISFFRGVNFEAKATDMTTLESFIEAEQYQASNEVTN